MRRKKEENGQQRSMSFVGSLVGSTAASFCMHNTRPILLFSAWILKMMICIRAREFVNPTLCVGLRPTYSDKSFLIIGLLN